MRKGITVEVTPADRARLQSIIQDRNSPQKHVWRARIIVLTADGAGTTAITRAVGKGETVVWRWQERFMHQGVEGLTRDKTRPSRIPPLPAETVDRVVALTNQTPPHAATHWTAPAMAKTVAISPSSVRRIWKGYGLQPHRVRSFKLSNNPGFADKLKDVGWPLCRSAGPCRGPQHRREKPNPSARPHPARAANEEGALRHDDPRLQAPRHHHPVRRPRHPRRQGHRALYAAPPASGVHPFSQQDQPRNSSRPA